MFKKILASIVLAFGLAFGVTSADTLPATYTIVNATTATVERVGPAVFYGVTSSAIQTTVVTVYDNASACSGNILWTGTPTPTAPSTGIPASGIKAVNGITSCIATSVVAPGYTVLTN